MVDKIKGFAKHRKGVNAMATPACQTPVAPAYSGLDSTAAIAAVLRRTAAGDSPNRPFVRDVSDIFFGLRQRGLRFRDLALRKIPGGYYSEDVETFVGQLLSMGYATRRSPIKLTPEGERFCQEIEDAVRDQGELIKLRAEVERLLQESAALA
jgi:hypothetical protein